MHALAVALAVASSLFAGGGIVALPKLIRRHQRKVAVEDRLMGREAVLDKNGAVIRPAVKSVFAELLERPALNGEWSELRADISEMKQWQVEHSGLHDAQSGVRRRRSG